MSNGVPRSHHESPKLQRLQPNGAHRRTDSDSRKAHLSHNRSPESFRRATSYERRERNDTRDRSEKRDRLEHRERRESPVRSLSKDYHDRRVRRADSERRDEKERRHDSKERDRTRERDRRAQKERQLSKERHGSKDVSEAAHRLQERGSAADARMQAFFAPVSREVKDLKERGAKKSGLDPGERGKVLAAGLLLVGNHIMIQASSQGDDFLQQAW